MPKRKKKTDELTPPLVCLKCGKEGCSEDQINECIRRDVEKAILNNTPPRSAEAASPAPATPTQEAALPEPAMQEATAEAPPQPADPMKQLIDNLNKTFEAIEANQKFLNERLGKLEGELATRGTNRVAAAAGREIPNPQAAEPSEPPAWLQALLAQLLPAIPRLLGAGEPAQDTAAAALSKRLQEYQAKQLNATMDRLFAAIDASDRGQLYIGDAPPNPDAKPMR